MKTYTWKEAFDDSYEAALACGARLEPISQNPPSPTGHHPLRSSISPGFRSEHDSAPASRLN